MAWQRNLAKATAIPEVYKHITLNKKEKLTQDTIFK